MSPGEPFVGQVVKKDHLLPIKLMSSWHLPSAQRKQMMDRLPVSNTLLSTVKLLLCLLLVFSFSGDFQPF